MTLAAFALGFAATLLILAPAKISGSSVSFPDQGHSSASNQNILTATASQNGAQISPKAGKSNVILDPPKSVIDHTNNRTEAVSNYRRQSSVQNQPPHGHRRNIKIDNGNLAVKGEDLEGAHIDLTGKRPNKNTRHQRPHKRNHGQQKPHKRNHGQQKPHKRNHGNQKPHKRGGHGQHNSHKNHHGTSSHPQHPLANGAHPHRAMGRRPPPRRASPSRRNHRG